ncbi:hypothetical protein [Planctomycetes bacterium K23_9]|uniref:DUF4292 domain-containing protein n=1 Tax=Stieleria marina TaxID=1930275 RepID=A0A517P180_9BACT|nr:hypothetical protein K239x_51460 [Planctomycetes bacterium K23_9]
MRTLSWVMIIAVCFVSGGATCARRDVPLPFPPAPAVLTETPSAAQVATAVNRTGRITQLSTNSATVDVLTMPNLPKLNATMSAQREKNFRLKASLPIILGAGMDLGSNDDVFWFEVPEGVSKTLYYANHQQYRQQLNRAILPVDPSWVMDALGLVQIDPALVVAGPVRRADGLLEIRSTMNLPNGMYQRVCLIHPRFGYVTHQFLYAPSGNLVASSEASNHKYYDEYQCALPHSVTLRLQPSVGPPLAMKIDVSSYAVNQLLTGDPQVFTMPTSASNAVDLTQLSASGGAAAMNSVSAGAGSSAATRAMPTTSPFNPNAPTAYTASGVGPMPFRGTVR